MVKPPPLELIPTPCRVALAAQAHGGEILASAALIDHVAQAGGFRFDDMREVLLKGIAARQRIARVAW